MSATNVAIPCGEPNGNERADEVTYSSVVVCCNICNDVVAGRAAYFLDKVILRASCMCGGGDQRNVSQTHAILA